MFELYYRHNASHRCYCSEFVSFYFHFRDSVFLAGEAKHELSPEMVRALEQDIMQTHFVAWNFLACFF